METSEAWIKKNCCLSSIQEVDEIRNFSLLWNYFEAEVCGKNGSYGKVAEYIQRFSETQFNEDQKEILEAVFKYFKNRYSLDSSGKNELFETLGLKKSSIKELRSDLEVGDSSVQKS
jgi:hypothetical protein